MVLNGYVHIDKETLGSGEFCKVKRAVLTAMEDEDGNFRDEEYAIKIYNKAILKKKIFYAGEDGLQLQKQLDLVHHEICVWEKLAHRNIAMIFSLLDADNSDFMYLVM